MFYALQTLRQLIDSPVSKDSSLPFVSINDYPDLPYRGVVEGFYGNPWSHEVRLSLIDFYGRNKMTDYIYGTTAPLTGDSPIRKTRRKTSTNW